MRQDTQSTQEGLSTVSCGIALADGARHQGWFIGRFLKIPHDLRSSHAVEVKWSTHHAGTQKQLWGMSEVSTTLCAYQGQGLLTVSGHGMCPFPGRGLCDLVGRCPSSMGSGTGIACPDGEMAFSTGSLSSTSGRHSNLKIEKADGHDALVSSLSAIVASRSPEGDDPAQMSRGGRLKEVRL